MTGISPPDLRLHVIRPVCDLLGLGGPAVEELLLGTAAQESGCGAHLAQIGGPALGVWQMEPATHDDIWRNFLSYRDDLAKKVEMLVVYGIERAPQLAGNLYYACAMARMQYLRSPMALPAAGDLEGQAACYKKVYNTPLGAATPEQYIANARPVLA